MLHGAFSWHDGDREVKFLRGFWGPSFQVSAILAYPRTRPAARHRGLPPPAQWYYAVRLG
ncbi:MAG: hypothetical protein ACLULH_10770 [Bacteroides fragilis]